jgi:hypothetical protein
MFPQPVMDGLLLPRAAIGSLLPERHRKVVIRKRARKSARTRRFMPVATKPKYARKLRDPDEKLTAQSPSPSPTSSQISDCTASSGFSGSLPSRSPRD